MDRITPQQLSDILVDFLDKFSYQDDICLARAEFHALQDYASEFLPHEKGIVACMSEYTHAAFHFLPLEIRQKATIYDAYQMSVDDLAFEQHDSLDGLCPQLSAQTEIQHPVWRGFFQALPGFLEFYGPYCQTTIIRGALEFIQATTVERTLFRGYADSKFPDYVRRMSAQGPVQAAVCFPEREFPQKEYLPIIASVEAELEDWVGTVNDLFSFYKESDTAVDRINYPLNASACTGRAPSEVLWEISDVALACKDRLESILKSAGKENVQCRVQEFLVGYVRYHLACDRYRIGELCDKSGDMDLLAYYQMSLRAVGALQGPFVPVYPKSRDRARTNTHMVAVTEDKLSAGGNATWEFAWLRTLFNKWFGS